MSTMYIIVYVAVAFIIVEASPIVCPRKDTDHAVVQGLIPVSNTTTTIVLKQCRITDIDHEVFENFHYLKHLDLAENKLKKLKLGVLDGFQQLTYLNLSFNMLTTFQIGLFDDKSNLEVLDLKGNKINHIENGLFNQLYALKYLDLSRNDILGQDIEPEVFNENKLITYLDFSSNNLSDAPDEILHPLETLQTLFLDGCSLIEIPTFVTPKNLKTLKQLSLSSNKISKIDDAASFVYLNNLEILDLSNNSIYYIDEDVFATMARLTKLILRDNNLVDISGLFKNTSSLIELDLSNNGLEFVPVNAFRTPTLKSLDLSKNRFTYLSENFCVELRNSGVRLKKFYFNDNPWQCACLNEVLREVKKYGIEYDGAKYNGEVPVCLAINEFKCQRNMNYNKEIISYLINFSGLK